MARAHSCARICCNDLSVDEDVLSGDFVLFEKGGRFNFLSEQ